MWCGMKNSTCSCRASRYRPARNSGAVVEVDGPTTPALHAREQVGSRARRGRADRSSAGSSAHLELGRDALHRRRRRPRPRSRCAGSAGAHHLVEGALQAHATSSGPRQAVRRRRVVGRRGPGSVARGTRGAAASATAARGRRASRAGATAGVAGAAAAGAAATERASARRPAAHRRRLEHRAQRHARRRCCDPARGQLRGQQRVAAELRRSRRRTPRPGRARTRPPSPQATIARSACARCSRAAHRFGGGHRRRRQGACGRSCRSAASGIVSSTTKCCGIMYSGSRSRGAGAVRRRRRVPRRFGTT